MMGTLMLNLRLSPHSLPIPHSSSSLTHPTLTHTHPHPSPIPHSSSPLTHPILTHTHPRPSPIPHSLFPSHNNLNWKYSRYDGDRDANLPTVLIKLEKRLGLKEQLRDDKVGTCVHLLLQMLNIIFIAGTVRVSMRIP